MSALSIAREAAIWPLAQGRAFISARRSAVLLSAVCLAALAAPLVLYLLLVPPLLARAYAGEPVAFLSDLLQPQSRSLESYQAQSRLLFSRLFLVCALVQFAAVARLFRADAWHLVRSFFAATTSPINLAIFRITLFAIVIYQINVPLLYWLSALPPDLRFAPTGLKPLLPYLPISPSVVNVVLPLFVVFCVLSLVGLWTRVSTLLALVFGVYILGVPQFFGKVDHDHHLFWFMCLMVTSRCGDALSVDSVRAAWRRADAGDTEPLQPARQYALPIRFAWLLIGVLYFFPGFWKFWSAGFDWAFSDNLKLRMYAKWMSLDHWQPLFRIDQYPPLYQAAALGTIAFELSFIVVIFFPYIRQMLALGGVLFHVMVYMFMRISFLTLLSMYVIFFNWPSIFGWIGRRLFVQPMYVLYDGNCGICRRAIATLRAFDLFGRITYINALDQAALAQHALDHLPEAELMLDMHAVVGERRFAGFAAYRAIAARIPWLWPALPWLYLRPVEALGTRIYRHVADSRACRVAQAPVASTQRQRSGVPVTMYATIAVGSVLVMGNVFFGAAKMDAAWPFVCYPRFDGIQSPNTTSLLVVAHGANGETLSLDHAMLRGGYAPAQINAVLDRVVKTTDTALLERRLSTLWNLWAKDNPELQQGRNVAFFKTTLAVDPALQAENPLRSERIATFNR